MKDKKDDNYSGPAGEKQRELFAEYEESRTKKKSGHLFRQDIALGKKISLQLSYENFILSFIILIMLFVVFFSLGVEKGKRINTAGARMPTDKEPVRLIKKEAPLAEKVSDMAEPGAREYGKIKPAEEIAKKKEPAVLLKPYTIQVIAFKREHEIRAKKELDTLKKNGYEAFTISAGEWIQVCIGRYASREETKKDIDSLRVKYPTCYVRKISN